MASLIACQGLKPLFQESKWAYGESGWTSEGGRMKMAKLEHVGKILLIASMPMFVVAVVFSVFWSDLVAIWAFVVISALIVAGYVLFFGANIALHIEKKRMERTERIRQNTPQQP
jgi:protein-S-isoprenylcysteine O-methyltransferase Ste14